MSNLTCRNGQLRKEDKERVHEKIEMNPSKIYLLFVFDITDILRYVRGLDRSFQLCYSWNDGIQHVLQWKCRPSKR